MVDKTIAKSCKTTIPTSFSVKLNRQARGSPKDFLALPQFGIYIISKGNKVLRVGESGSGEKRLLKGFRDPLRRKLRGKDRKNYIAYAWRKKYPNQSLNIDYFELKESQLSDNHFRRALEAEITFQFRLVKRRWPIEMSEIHFLERYRKDPLLIRVTKAILSYYEVRYNTTV
jgi:hypothetical protein